MVHPGNDVVRYTVLRLRTSPDQLNCQIAASRWGRRHCRVCEFAEFVKLCEFAEFVKVCRVCETPCRVCETVVSVDLVLGYCPAWSAARFLKTLTAITAPWAQQSEGHSLSRPVGLQYNPATTYRKGATIFQSGVKHSTKKASSSLHE